MLKIRKLTVGGVTYELAGEKGDPGEQGIRGEKGDKGDKGEPGAGLETVLPLIPEEASQDNQLADKAYVDAHSEPEKTYVLKNQITLEEDVDSLILTADDNGNPYDYQDVLIFWKVKKKTTADSAMIRLNAHPQIPTSDTIVYISNPPIKTYDFFVAARAYIQGGRMFTNFRGAVISAYYEAAYPLRPESLGVNESNSISLLRFWGENSVTAGTTIQIYALEG